MSLSTDIERLNTAKSNLTSWLTTNDVTVPSGTKIDGLVGLLESVSLGLPITHGTMTMSSDNAGKDVSGRLTIMHNLGMVPDFFMIWNTKDDVTLGANGYTYEFLIAGGASNKLTGVGSRTFGATQEGYSGSSNMGGSFVSLNSGDFLASSNSITDTSNSSVIRDQRAYVYNATSTTIILYASRDMIAGTSFAWIAVGGL